MSPLQPSLISRDDLLDDLRFWGLLYEYYLLPRVGDAFTDGHDYYLCVSEDSVQAFCRRLEGLPVPPGHFPEFAVTMPLRNGWRVGVRASFYPEDFSIDDVIVPPGSSPVLIGVNGGNSRLPALRWDELLAISRNTLSGNRMSEARLVLLLFLGTDLNSEVSLDEVRNVLGRSWRESGLTVRVDEFTDRLLENIENIRTDTRWRRSEESGWTCDAAGSPRNLNSGDGPQVALAMRQLFSTLSPSQV